MNDKINRGEVFDLSERVARLGSELTNWDQKVLMAEVAVALLLLIPSHIEEGNRSEAEGGSTAKLSDVDYNRLAQFVYEGISDSTELELRTNMTAKSELVEILKTAMSRVNEAKESEKGTHS